MRRKLVREDWGGEMYEYYPLGQYVVMAPGICGGRPTFKCTRIDVKHVLSLLSAGRTVEEIVADYNRPEVTREAVEEALQLATEAFVSQYGSPKAKAA